jgi:antitoxin ParD1/3/4
MPTRNINLTPHQDEQVTRYVASGRYQNASEVFREGLRMLETRDAEEAARLEGLRTAIGLGIQAIGSGDFREFASAADLAGYLESLPLDSREL